MPIWCWILLSAIVYVAFWFLILIILGYCSGWRAIAGVYRHRGPYEGTRRRFRSIRLGGAKYNGAVTVGTNAEGLYLAMFLLFRPGHPPILIPWVDVSVQEVKGWFWTQYLELRFSRVLGVRLLIPQALGREIAADANQAWDLSGVRNQ